MDSSIRVSQFPDPGDEPVDAAPAAEVSPSGWRGRWGMVNLECPAPSGCWISSTASEKVSLSLLAEDAPDPLA